MFSEPAVLVFSLIIFIRRPLQSVGKKTTVSVCYGSVPPLLKPADSRAICFKDFVFWDERSTTESKDEELIHVLS